MKTAQRPTIRERAERIGNVALSLPWCQPRLRPCRTRPCKKIGAERKVPEAGEPCRQDLALVVAALAAARCGEWHGHESGALVLDVRRKAQASHAARHRVTQRVPSVVLECVDDRLDGGAGKRIRRPHSADERWQQWTPCTRCRRPRDVDRVPASLAARTWKLLRAKPARAAHELALVARSRSATDGAHRWQQEVQQRARGAPDPCTRQRSARHMALRSGSMPNQRWNESAPCSTSIPSPSAARCPASLAARTHAVSLER
jgi:hypothetical protein